MENKSTDTQRNIELKIKSKISVYFLPTSRHRNEKEMLEDVEIPVKIKCLDEKDFPVAFRVTDHAYIIDGMDKKTYDELERAEASKLEKSIFSSEELRYFDGKIYKPVHVNLHGTLNSSLIESDPKFIENTIAFSNKNTSWWADSNKKDFDKEKSIINEKQREYAFNDKKEKILKEADSYAMFNGQIWKECGEPYYHIQSFGFGRNYETNCFIEYYLSHYTSNVLEGDNNYTALNKNEMVENFSKWNAVPKAEMEQRFDRNIEVLMPEVVRLEDKIDVQRELDSQIEKKETVSIYDITGEADKLKENPIEAIGKEFEENLKRKSLVEPNPYNATRAVLNDYNWRKEDQKKALLNQYFKNHNITSKKAYDEYFGSLGFKKKNREQVIEKPVVSAKKSKDDDLGYSR